MKFNVDQYVDELMEKHKDRNFPEIFVLTEVKEKLRSLVWILEYANIRMMEEINQQEKVS